MKVTSLFTFVSLCLLAGHVQAVSFPNTYATDSVSTDVLDVATFTPTEAALLHQAGVSVVRTAFYWDIAEGSKGFEWDPNTGYTDYYGTFLKTCASRSSSVLECRGHL